jgi:response regulator RpfG family c-di-GMP phosphodiesterase
MAEQDENLAVLYVDDERKSLKMFQLLCQDQFRVMTASTAHQGLALLNKHGHEIGVIVADRCMAGPTGIWLLHRARQLHPHMVRILASDGCNPAAEEASLRDGTAQGMICIPWEPAELKKRLRTELERVQEEQGR